MTYGLLESLLDKIKITLYQGNLALLCLPYNRPSPSGLEHDAQARNLRTIIVIADIHRGLYGPAHNPKTMYLPRLTFRHWSGVTPYTSSFEFAGSCVFGKQLPGSL